MLFIVIGCSSLNDEPRQATETRLTNFDYSAHCYGEKTCLTRKDNYFSRACDQGSAQACYEYAMVREERGDDLILILQVYQQACDKGDQQSCKAIKRLLTSQCVKGRTHPQYDSKCYETFEEMAERTKGQSKNTGVSYHKRIRKNTEACNSKLEEAQKGLGCSSVAEYEAKRGNYIEAEKIYKDGCNATNIEGCLGLLCFGYIKMNQGAKKEALALFDQACKYDEQSSEGCYHKTNPKYFLRSLKEMPEKEKSCLSDWQKSWGPSTFNQQQ